MSTEGFMYRCTVCKFGCTCFNEHKGIFFCHNKKCALHDAYKVQTEVKEGSQDVYLTLLEPRVKPSHRRRQSSAEPKRNPDVSTVASTRSPLPRAPIPPEPVTPPPEPTSPSPPQKRYPPSASRSAKYYDNEPARPPSRKRNGSGNTNLNPAEYGRLSRRFSRGSIGEGRTSGSGNTNLDADEYARLSSRFNRMGVTTGRGGGAGERSIPRRPSGSQQTPKRYAWENMPVAPGFEQVEGDVYYTAAARRRMSSAA